MVYRVAGVEAYVEEEEVEEEFPRIEEKAFRSAEEEVEVL